MRVHAPPGPPPRHASPTLASSTRGSSREREQDGRGSHRRCRVHRARSGRRRGPIAPCRGDRPQAGRCVAPRGRARRRRSARSPTRRVGTSGRRRRGVPPRRLWRRARSTPRRRHAQIPRQRPCDRGGPRRRSGRDHGAGRVVVVGVRGQQERSAQRRVRRSGASRWLRAEQGPGRADLRRSGCGGWERHRVPPVHGGRRGTATGNAFARWIEAARAGRPLRMLGSPDRTATSPTCVRCRAL